MDDIFAKIIAREIPAEILYEDEDAIAILDIAPNNPGHTLVIPKKPIRNVFDADADTWAKVMEVVRQLAPAIRDAMNADGVNIISNHEEAAHQAVFHLHVHIIPRHADDGNWYASWPHQTYAPGQAAETAAKIRAALS
jgi:histidine triad (HIT) family protein